MAWESSSAAAIVAAVAFAGSRGLVVVALHSRADAVRALDGAALQAGCHDVQLCAAQNIDDGDGLDLLEALRERDQNPRAHSVSIARQRRMPPCHTTRPRARGPSW